MEGDEIRAAMRVKKTFRKRIEDHQMDIQEAFRKALPKKEEIIMSEGDVRHELPIHHVEMKEGEAFESGAFGTP